MYTVTWETCTYPDSSNCTVCVCERVLHVLQRTQCQLTPRLASHLYDVHALTECSPHQPAFSCPQVTQ